MRPDDEGDGHSLLAADVLLVHGAKVARCDHIDAGLGAPTQHEPAISEISLLSIDALGDVDACGNVRAAVMTVLQVHRQPGEVGIRSGPYHLVYGRHGTRHFNRSNWCRALESLFEQTRCADAESERQSAA